MRLIPLVLVALLVAAPLSPQVAQPPGEAFAVPVSADRIVLKVATNDGVDATLTVPNGGMARVKRVGGGTVGLVPLPDGAALQVMVAVIDRSARTGAESVRQVGRLRVGVAERTTVQTPAFDLDVTWVETQPPAPAPAAPLGPCTTCCITCLDYTICACEVVMPCGRCCCPAGGCGCEPAGLPDAALPAGMHRGVPRVLQLGELSVLPVAGRPTAAGQRRPSRRVRITGPRGPWKRSLHAAAAVEGDVGPGRGSSGAEESPDPASSHGIGSALH